jgi:hypothetical protein
MRTLITILVCLALVSSAAAQQKTVTVTPVEGPVLTAGAAGPAGVCVYGNDGAATWALGDWIWGQESYAAVFDAVQPPCGCAAGFTIEAVHLYMQFDVEDVPATFDASVGFGEALFDEAAQCFVPGTPDCNSATFTVTVDTPGLYDIALPIDPASCPCAFFDYRYAVYFNILTLFPETGRPSAVTDDFPLGCVSWNDYGAGWEDTHELGFPGKIIIFADVVCCENPVPTEERAWGEIKSLYR